MNLLKKLFVYLMCITMLFTMVPVMGNVYAAEEDTRIPVNAITATTPSGSFPPVYGAEVSRLIFTSEQAAFPLNMGDWQKKVDGVWIDVAPGTTFTEGTYKYEAQVRIDEVSPLSGDEYIIEVPCTVTVNGVSWTTMTNRAGDIGYSYGWTESPEYIIERPADAPLVFAEYTEYINSYDRIAIDEINLASHVSGGEGAYTFSKISGPSWINVSGNGVITGTPTTVGSNDNLVVRVTDEANTYREITISVEKTKMNPGDRIKVSSITASTASGSIRPMYGDTVSIPNFISDAAFPQHMGDWQKKVGEEWVDVTNGTTFTEGTYRYWAQVRIDETSTLPGDKYVLGDSCTVTVNGVAWTTMASPAVGNTYSYNHSISPEYVVLNPGNLQYGEVIVNDTSLYDGSEKRPSVTVKDLNGKVLVQDTDYTVSYENNVNVGTGKVIITGIGNYSGTKETEFKVILNPVKVDARKATITSDGVKAHYEIKETNKWYKDAGCTELITNHNDYIIPKASNIRLSTTAYSYSGKKKTPTLTIKDSKGRVLRNGTDYSYTMSSGRKNIGTYYYYITFKGNYYGKKTISFVINPKGTTNYKPTRGKGYLIAKWSRRTTKMPKKRIYGYQIAYSTNSNFSGAKYKNIKGYTKNSYKIKKLKRKTYYYIKVRTRIKVSGKYYYSAWSKVKVAKTK